MSLSGLLVFALALLVTAGSPGPSIAALVARVLSRGLRGVLPFLAAMWIGEALYLTMAVAGLAALAQTFQLAFTVLKCLGVGYLLYLAWSGWRAPVDGRVDALPARRGGWGMFGAGLAVTMGNPKIMVFYLALLPTIVDLRGAGPLVWVQLVTTMLLVLVIADLGWAAVAGRARRWLTSRRAVRAANRVGAGMMAGAAVAIATR